MRQFKLVVQYDGTDYVGFQSQPNGPSVQDELQRAVRRVLGHDVKTLAASRTDAGVHALGQVVSVGGEGSIPVTGLVQALNDSLPMAVSIVCGEEVTEQFHPRHDAIGKLYSYRILNRKLPSPFIERYAWRVQEPLDTALMARAATFLLGRHDFTGFEATGGSVRDKVRCLRRVDCDRSGQIVEIRVEGDGFLYKMVRNIVGTLVEVGSGRMCPEQINEILGSRDRSRAGPTAPGRGLCLVRVDY